VVVEGEAFNITCQTDVFAFIKWQKDSRPIVGGLLQQYNVTEHRGDNAITSSISNSRAQTSHSGSYRCGTFVENSYNLYVLSGKGDLQILCLACVNVPNMCDMAWLFTAEVFVGIIPWMLVDCHMLYKEADTPRNILTYLPFASCTKPKNV
jgi:hypothetical protein